MAPLAVERLHHLPEGPRPELPRDRVAPGDDLLRVEYVVVVRVRVGPTRVGPLLVSAVDAEQSGLLHFVLVVPRVDQLVCGHQVQAQLVHDALALATACRGAGVVSSSAPLGPQCTAAVVIARRARNSQRRPPHGCHLSC